MTPGTDHPHERRPLLLPVVIATVLLTIIGTTGGFLLGEKRNRQVTVSASPSPSPEPMVTGPLCPRQTQKAGAARGATGTLHEVLRVRTNRKLRVWICMDQAGQLYYHSHKGGTEVAWVEGKSAYFLAQVQRDSRGRYVGEAPAGNVVTVDRKRVVFQYTSGRRQEHKVIGE